MGVFHNFFLMTIQNEVFHDIMVRSLEFETQKLGDIFTICNVNGLNNPECYITLSRKGSPWTNTEAFWAHSLATNKMKCCKYGPGVNVQKNILKYFHKSFLTNFSSCVTF